MYVDYAIPLSLLQHASSSFIRQPQIEKVPARAVGQMLKYVYVNYEHRKDFVVSIYPEYVIKNVSYENELKTSWDSVNVEPERRSGRKEQSQ
jgi:hypothetical protein